MRYRFFEHTADIKFRAYGENLNKAFENAGIAFSEVITDTSKIKPTIKESFTIKSDDLKSLLYDFLEELLVFYDVGNYVFSKFNVRINKSKKTLVADVYGELINNHKLRNSVKAITYSEMFIKKYPKGYVIQVVLDL